jgi:hypothetical protein
MVSDTRSKEMKKRKLPVIAFKNHLPVECPEHPINKAEAEENQEASPGEFFDIGEDLGRPGFIDEKSE